jgi:hypothetical protein
MSRFTDWSKARKRSGASKAIAATVGLYELGSDPAGEMRFSAGGREQNVFDLLLSNPAVSPDTRVIHMPFLDDYDINTTNRWDESNSGSGTSLTIQDAIGNKAKVTNGGLDNNYYYYELKYEKAQLQSGKDVWFYTSIEIGDVDEADLFVGLCADLASGDLFDNRVDCIGFTLADGSAILQAVCTKDSTGSPTSTALTLSDATEYWVGFHSNGTSYVDFFAGIKGAETQRVRISTNLPDDEILAPAFGIRNGTGGANTLTISDIWCFVDR